MPDLCKLQMKNCTYLHYCNAYLSNYFLVRSLLQFGISFLIPSMRITWWKCCLFSISAATEYYLLTSAPGCALPLFGKTFLVCELLPLVHSLYHSICIALSGIIANFANTPEEIVVLGGRRRLIRRMPNRNRPNRSRQRNRR
jgi:hypothetical protein